MKASTENGTKIISAEVTENVLIYEYENRIYKFTFVVSGDSAYFKSADMDFKSDSTNVEVGDPIPITDSEDD